MEVPDDEIQAINIWRGKFHGEWNCIITPNQQPSWRTYSVADLNDFGGTIAAATTFLYAASLMLLARKPDRSG